jgi:DNA polymerase-3 subunit gamma/tau
MTYLVLARKWRPQTFSEVVGQEHITGTLKKAVEKGRLAHAYLFAGPRGCGKTTTARLLAKIINCEHPKGSEPDNECASCLAINEGRHLDVIEIDGASNRGIDEIRDLREKISYAPSQGRSKIYIIDEVHMLTTQAFNALLKTLEEPPAHVYLVFATTEPHKVPATILSRCQRFNFKRLELKEISSQLEKICTAEKIPFEAEALTLVARRAEGSMRDAESLLDQCIAASDGTVGLDLVRRVLGLVDASLVTELLGAIAARDRRTALAIVDRAVDSGLDLEEFFLAYVEGLRNLLVLSVEGGSGAGLLDLTKGEAAELAEIAKAFRTENLLYLFRAAVRVYRELRTSGQPRYLLEAALAEAASWEDAVELSELIRKLDTPGSPKGPAETSRQRKAEAAPPKPPRPERAEPAEAGRFEPGGSRDGEAPGAGCGEAAGSPLAEAPGAAVVDAAGESRIVRPTAGPATGRAGAVGEEGGARGGAYARLDTSTPVAPHTAEEDLALAEIGGREAWERFLAQVRESKLTLGIWLMSARVSRIAGERCCLSFAPQNRFAREMVLEDKNKRLIEYHLERFFGRKLVVEASEQCETAAGDAAGEALAKDAGGARRAAVARGAAGAPASPGRKGPVDPELEAIAGGEPVIRRLIEDFDAELFKDKG